MSNETGATAVKQPAQVEPGATSLPKGERTALRIRDCAAELFFDQGYDKTTVAAVAQRADTATGTVLLHFGSKASLAAAAFGAEVRIVVRQLASDLSGTSAQQDLHDLVQGLLEWYAAHDRVVAALLKESLFDLDGGNGEYDETVDATMSLFSGILASHVPALTAERSALLGQALVAHYLVVLLRGFRGAYHCIDDQVAHFDALVDALINPLAHHDQSARGV